MWCKVGGASVTPWRGGWALAAALGACARKPSSPVAFPSLFSRDACAWTNSCERASSSPLVSCNYCPSVLLERDHLLLLHHQSSSYLPGVALSPENMANHADGAPPEVPRCSLRSVRSKAATPSADAPAMRSGGSAGPPSLGQDTLAKKRKARLVLPATGNGSW